jgi:vacuolar-type H+-ATPase subunit H
MAKRTDVGGGQAMATPNLDPTHELPAAGETSPGSTSTFQGAKDQAKDLAQGAKEQAKGLAGDAKEQAKDMANQARDHVQTLVGEQKDQAAERLGSLAQALREAGQKLNEGQQAGDFGRYADRAAQQVERLSNYLRDNDLRSFVRDTETFARRRPEVFLGGTLIAGLMLARFLKASSPAQGASSGYDGGLRTGYPQSARGSYASPGRSSYTPERNDLSRPGQSNVANAGTTPYNEPLGV